MSDTTPEPAPHSADDAAAVELGAVLVAAGSVTLAEALATTRSVDASAGSAKVLVLATERVRDRFEGIEVLPVADVLPTGSVGTAIFGDDDLLSFAEPFALARLVDRYGSVASVQPGSFVVGRPHAIERSLAGHSVVLTSQALVAPADDALPHVTLRDPGRVVSPVLVAVGPDSAPALELWQATMLDALHDPDQSSPASLRPRVLATLAGRHDVTIEGTSTVVAWSTYAEIESSGGDASRFFVIDAAELWDLALNVGTRVQGEMTQAEYRLVDRRVHDASPLVPLTTAIEASASDARPIVEPLPYDVLTTAIRRASDPDGTTWRSSDGASFSTWLGETNHRGVTRLADLVWYGSAELMRTFPDARSDPAAYLAWCRTEGRRRLGFDATDPDLEPWMPSPQQAASPSGLRSALAWRWNVLKGLVPGVAAAGERKAMGLDVVSGPSARSGPGDAHAVDVTREPSVWGRDPRRLTLMGCFRAESGLGQASRASLSAVRSLDIPFSWIDTSAKYPSRNAARVDLDPGRFGATGDVNLIHANAMEIVRMNDTVFRHRLGGRFNAAMWFWEAGNVPAWYLDAFDRVDELWVASSYLVDVFGQFGRVPVHDIGLAPPLPTERVVDREALGLHPDDFIFLFVYDALSSHGRKNPELVLEAFIEAFGAEADGVRFVLKASNLNKLPVDRERLFALAETSPAITIIDRYLDHEQVYDLMAASDVYVSLHAAEGYGLTILEAMSLGTPTICTGYSGNMDFTTSDNSWLVDYDLVRTTEIAGPYPAGSLWAMPDRSDAARLMRRAAEDPGEVAAKGRNARIAARAAASPERYAANLEARLRTVL
jgi:glycosyltransferase involved in cell wall biosynthesis